MNAEQQIDAWGQIVAKAWQDEAFKKQLVANPKAVFTQEGIDMPAGVQIHVVENTPTLLHLTLPAMPGEGEISDGQLDAVAGGSKGTIASALDHASTWLALQGMMKETKSSSRAAAQ
jgi:hypothetical protein